MKNITIFDNAGVKPDAGAVMRGIRMGILDPLTICDYAERVIDETSEGVGEYVDMLVFEGDHGIFCLLRAIVR